MLELSSSLYIGVDTKSKTERERWVVEQGQAAHVGADR